MPGGEVGRVNPVGPGVHVSCELRLRSKGRVHHGRSIEQVCCASCTLSRCSVSSGRRAHAARKGTSQATDVWDLIAEKGICRRGSAWLENGECKEGVVGWSVDCKEGAVSSFTSRSAGMGVFRLRMGV